MRKYLHNTWLAATRKYPVFFDEVRICSVSESKWNAWFTLSYSNLPFSVRVTPFDLRIKSVVFKLSSSLLIAILTAGWEIYNCFAAFDMLLHSATDRNILYFFFFQKLLKCVQYQVIFFFAFFCAGHKECHLSFLG